MPNWGKIGLLGFMTVGLLSACDELGLGPSTSEEPPQIGTTQRILSGETERPDVFEQTGDAVWDGLPTLGGRWVASTQTNDLERVRVTRTDNGQSIEAALFRIEPGTPGPGLILSSDAARALQIAPGTSTPITIVALRSRPEPTPPAEEDAGIIATPLEPQRSDDGTEATAAETPVAATTEGTEAAQSEAIPRARPDDLASTETGTDTAAAAPVPGPSDASVEPVQAVPTASGPILEVGRFETENDADIVLAQLASREIVAQKREERRLFSTRWLVFAGPFENSADMIAARKAAREAGYDGAKIITP
ncbi:MAG: SPOR domain-containing protein [Pseudomonadota bacterium]